MVFLSSALPPTVKWREEEEEEDESFFYICNRKSNRLSLSYETQTSSKLPSFKKESKSQGHKKL